METKSNTFKLRKKIWTRHNTIPVIVDNTVNLPGYNMVRFFYFSIDATESPKPFRLKAKNQIIPFLLTGYTAGNQFPYQTLWPSSSKSS